jgi:eukaryotic-like serine/threonine-protein kinase
MERKPGDRIGPYELVSAIGKGGMGEVWKAWDKRLHRDVAIKFCAHQFSDRFLREARAIAALNHPNICTLHDIGPDYLVMEFIEGTPPRGPLAPPEAVRLALGIAAALEAAHIRGITHRDLKPVNILVTQSGLKLLDFGLALVNDNSPVDIADAPTALSVAGAVMGTVAYMSPEQAQGKPADARSDIFSLGVVLYEMLSGRQAFAGNSVGETMAAIMRDEPAPLDAPANVAAIITRCLRKSPASRFQTMSEVHEALEQVKAMPAGNTASLAVLPFVNMSADKENEYFSDGLAEEILNLLAKIPALKVIARTSSFAFRGKDQDIRKIAEALGVAHVLEGSVRRAGNRIRVTAQLIAAADGSHIWSERYDRELTDVFAVQDEIASAVAGALRVRLAGAPPSRHQPNLAAYEAFLQGRHQMEKLNPEGYELGRKYLDQAIALDPEYAEPHSALGEYYYYLAISNLRPSREAMPLARAAATRALELEPSNAGAHAVLCFVAAFYDYDWTEAEKQHRLTTAGQAPAWALAVAALHLNPLGRFEQAVREMEAALAQDPLNVVPRTLLLSSLNWAGLYDRAIVEARKAIEIDEHTWNYHLSLALGYSYQGRFAEGREPAERAFQLAPRHPYSIGNLAGILACLGEKDRADQLVAQMPETAATGLMFYHCYCSNIDAALDWCEKAIEIRHPGAVSAACSTFLKPLRESPRWAAIAKKMNLP